MGLQSPSGQATKLGLGASNMIHRSVDHIMEDFEAQDETKLLFSPQITI